jgi:Ca2+-binding EF-hand superfamily protein
LSDATIRDAQSVVRRYDETPDGRLDLNEFAQLVSDLEAGVVRSDAVSPSPNPISPYSGRYTSPGAPEHRWARHMQRKLDEADDRWRLLSGVRSEMQAVRLEAQELTDHATMALSHIELKRREAEERALAAEKESADSQARIRDAERLAEFASAAWKNTEARLVAKEKQAATERKRLLQEAADLKRDAHRIISGRSSTSPFLRPPQIVTPLSEAPQYHSLSTFAEPSPVTRAFYHFDANKSGFLGYRELRDALRHYGLSDATIRDAQSVLRRYDDTPDGRLDLNEFAELVRDLEAGVIRSPVAPLGGVTAGWTPPDERSSASPLVPMPHDSPAVSSHVRQAFARFQQNGLISKPDLVAALSQYGLSITEEEVRAISIAYGEQSSGLNVYEFAALVSDVEFGLSSSLRAPGATSAKSKLYGASPPQQRPVQSLPRPSQPESQIAATQMRRPTATETKYPMNTQAVESSAVRAPMSSAPDWWQTRRWCLCFCPDVLPDSVVVRDLLRKDPL